MKPLPDKPISPAHNMHETCQSSSLTMPSHNELRGFCAASQLRNCASVRLPAIIHSFWWQSLSIQVSAGLRNDGMRKIDDVPSAAWSQSGQSYLQQSAYAPAKRHVNAPATAPPSPWQQLIDMKWLHMAVEPQICTFHKTPLRRNGQRRACNRSSLPFLNASLSLILKRMTPHTAGIILFGNITGVQIYESVVVLQW